MKILVIDWDIVLYKCIQLYNEYVEDESQRIPAWNNLNHEFNIDRFATIDTQIYHKIGRLISFICKEKKTVYVGNENSGLLYALETEILKGNFNPTDNKIELINIDHHHCLYDMSKKNVTNKNWVSFLNCCGLISRYVWINDKNSEKIDLTQLKQDFILKTYTQSIHDCDINDDLFQNIDCLYICTNFNYIPPQFDHLVLNTLRIPCKILFEDVTFLDNSYETYISELPHYGFLKEIVKDEQ